MKQIRKEEFLEMLELGFLDGKHKGAKTWTITNVKKGKSTRKKYYIAEDRNYNKYLAYKRSKSNK